MIYFNPKNADGDIGTVNFNGLELVRGVIRMQVVPAWNVNVKKGVCNINNSTIDLRDMVYESTYSVMSNNPGVKFNVNNFTVLINRSKLGNYNTQVWDLVPSGTKIVDSETGEEFIK